MSVCLCVCEYVCVRAHTPFVLCGPCLIFWDKVVIIVTPDWARQRDVQRYDTIRVCVCVCESGVVVT